MRTFPMPVSPHLWKSLTDGPFPSLTLRIPISITTFPFVLHQEQYCLTFDRAGSGWLTEIRPPQPLHLSHSSISVCLFPVPLFHIPLSASHSGSARWETNGGGLLSSSSCYFSTCKTNVSSNWKRLNAWGMGLRGLGMGKGWGKERKQPPPALLSLPPNAPTFSSNEIGKKLSRDVLTE